jgi:HSP20 family protein
MKTAAGESFPPPGNAYCGARRRSWRAGPAGPPTEPYNLTQLDNGPASWTLTIPPVQPPIIMNQLTRWDPFRELESMHRHLTSLFDRPSRGDDEFITVAEWAPTVDIVEDDKNYTVKAELPDVKKEDVHVSVENGVLTLTGERKFEKEEKNRKYHRTERSYGKFARSFSLPTNIDPEKVSASYKDGILNVTVAKSEKAMPKQIEIKVD